MLSLAISASLSWSNPVTWSKPEAQETIILVMRHGETWGNNASDENTYTYTGCGTSFSLTEQGITQANLVAQKIGELVASQTLEISAIYSSPLTRAVETATPLSEILELPIEQRENLREINWGIADGQLVRNITSVWGAMQKEIEAATHLSRRQKWDELPVIPEAEKYNQVLARVTQELNEIAAAHKGQVVLVVTHGRVVKCLTGDALDLEDKLIPYPKNGGIVVFRAKEGQLLEFVEVRDPE